MMRCCRDWPIDERSHSLDLCPRCGMRRTLVVLREQQR